jgi:D-aminopeptidase
MSQRQLPRELGLKLGRLQPGPLNAITDVPGVRVGHSTLVQGDGPLQPGHGPIRTGVTAILPHGGNLFAEKVRAGLFVLNGFGKSIGLAQVEELGTIETPILLTNTLSAPRVADALIDVMIAQNPGIGITTSTVNPLVGECNDGFLNDIQGRHVTPAMVHEALETATTGPVQQGAVGAGTGTVCFGFKGGIGSASRQAAGYTIGALVQTNFGRREELLIGGFPVGEALANWQEAPEAPPGSVLVILATDAPLESRQLTRIAKRGALGLARVGGSAANGSGDFILAFSTANRVPHQATEPLEQVTLLRDDALSPLFQAAVEAVAEAVTNSLFAATSVIGRDGNRAPGLPVELVLDLLAERRAATSEDGANLAPPSGD